MARGMLPKPPCPATSTSTSNDPRPPSTAAAGFPSGPLTVVEPRLTESKTSEVVTDKEALRVIQNNNNVVYIQNFTGTFNL